jgi:hypothetical protein
MSTTLNCSKKSNGWLRACIVPVLLCALLASQAAALDYSAVERKLGEAVAEGDLSLEQAAVMMRALRTTQQRRAGVARRVGAWAQRTGDEIRAAAEAGEMSPEDAWSKWQSFKRDEFLPKMAALVRSGQMNARTSRGLMRRMRMAETGQRLKGAAARGDTTKEEARAASKEIRGKRHTRDRDEGLVSHYKRLGVSPEGLGEIKEALADAGVSDRQMEAALGGMIRVAHMMREQGEDFELGPRLWQHFEGDLGLTEGQVRLMVGLAERVAAKPERERER